MMKYFVFAALILAAPMAFAQSDAVVGNESHHSESYDASTTDGDGHTVATHDAVVQHAESTGTVAAPVAGATSSSVTTDETHTTSHDDSNND